MKRLYQIFAAIVLLAISSGCTSASVVPIVIPEATADIPTSAPMPTFIPTPTSASVSTAEVLEFNFDQKFEDTKCPSGSAVDAVCLNVSGTASDSVLGEIKMTRVAILDVAGKKDDNQCVSAFTHGKLTIGGDLATFNALGIFCPGPSTATYTYILTGGTGVNANASGSGVIKVPVPTGSGSGTELWSGTLLK